MNEYEKFLELPNEKQLKIINAGFEYFGKYGYKGVNTEDIANRAGISKGLLFYYFKNKESYYLFLCEFCQNLMLPSFTWLILCRLFFIFFLLQMPVIFYNTNII